MNAMKKIISLLREMKEMNEKIEFLLNKYAKDKDRPICHVEMAGRPEKFTGEERKRLGALIKAAKEEKPLDRLDRNRFLQ